MAERPARTDSRTVGRHTAGPAAGQIGHHMEVPAVGPVLGLAVGLRVDSAAAALVGAGRPTTASALGRRWAQPGAVPAGWAGAPAAELAAAVRSTTYASGHQVPAYPVPGSRVTGWLPGWVAGLAARPAFGPGFAQYLALGSAPASGLGWLLNSRANQFQYDQKSQPPSPAGWHSISANRGRKPCQAFNSPSTRSTPT